MNVFSKIYTFYRDGFAGMTVGRSLWILIIIKVAVLFLVLKLFFFPNVVEKQSHEEGLTPSEVVKSSVMNRTTQSD